MQIKVIQTIQAVIVRGDGSDQKPRRHVFQYYSFEGDLLAEFDPFLNAPTEQMPVRNEGE